MVNLEKIATKQLICTWYERARIDYSDLYVKQYIAYNAWFRKVTHCDEDYAAIQLVMKRFVIWDDYIHGRTLTPLEPIVERIALLTRRRPLANPGNGWDGIVKNPVDWRGLIYFWYRTRCDLFHGQMMPGQQFYDEQIKLAYESLSVFMAEILHRMRYCFSDADVTRLHEVRALIDSTAGPLAELRVIEDRLCQKFIGSTDIWNVDMERV